MEDLKTSLWIVRSKCGDEFLYQPNYSSTISLTAVADQIEADRIATLAKNYGSAADTKPTTSTEFAELLKLRGWEIVRIDQVTEFPSLTVAICDPVHCWGAELGREEGPTPAAVPILQTFLTSEQIGKGYDHCSTILNGATGYKYRPEVESILGSLWGFRLKDKTADAEVLDCLEYVAPILRRLIGELWNAGLNTSEIYNKLHAAYQATCENIEAFRSETEFLGRASVAVEISVSTRQAVSDALDKVLKRYERVWGWSLPVTQGWFKEKLLAELGL